MHAREARHFIQIQDGNVSPLLGTMIPFAQTMRIRTSQCTQNQPAAGFDLFRLSKSKQAVDVCPNTIRGYAKQGLNLYRRGKAVFVSRAELHSFILSGGGAA